MAIALSGKDFWRQARQLGLHQPILMLTVRRDEIDMALRLGIGADDYLTNPYGLRELLCEVLMRDQWRIPGG